MLRESPTICATLLVLQEIFIGKNRVTFKNVLQEIFIGKNRVTFINVLHGKLDTTLLKTPCLGEILNQRKTECQLNK